MLASVSAGVVAAALCALARHWRPTGSHTATVAVRVLSVGVGLLLATIAVFGTIIGVSVMAGGDGWRGVLVLVASVAGAAGGATLLARSGHRS